METAFVVDVLDVLVEVRSNPSYRSGRRAMLGILGKNTSGDKNPGYRNCHRGIIAGAIMGLADNRDQSVILLLDRSADLKLSDPIGYALSRRTVNCPLDDRIVKEGITADFIEWIETVIRGEIGGKGRGSKEQRAAQ